MVIKYVFRFMKDYKVQSILGPLFKLFEAILELLVPIVVAGIIDNGLGLNDSSVIIRNGILLVVFAVVGLSFSVTAQYFSARSAVGCTSKMRIELFDKLQNLYYSQVDRMSTSSMITRLTGDMNQVQTGINLVLRLLLRSPFVVFGAMIMAFTVNAKAAVMFAVLIPILFIIVFGIMIFTIPLYKRIQSKLEGIISISRENLSGARVIRAFCREEDEISEFKVRNTALNRFQKFVGRISGILNPATYIVINAGIIILIKKGALMIDSGDLSGGQLVALYNYMSQILVELIKFANLVITVTKSVACANRIASVLDMKTQQDDGSAVSPDNYDIVFDNVSLMYDRTSVPAIENITFCAKQGERIGIIGGTGSGKTSLINLIPGFYKPTGGTVTIGGIDLSEWDHSALRDMIGVVPQKAVLFKGTVRENIRWGSPYATDCQIMQALEISQADGFIEEKPLKLDEPVEQYGRNFSGGQRQRLTIARAVVKSPKILILDDSMSALDYETDAKLRRSLNQLKDTTVFFVTQRAHSVIDCDRIIVLDDGKQVGVGTHSQLLENCDIYREIFYTQFEKGADYEK